MKSKYLFVFLMNTQYIQIFMPQKVMKDKKCLSVCCLRDDVADVVLDADVVVAATGKNAWFE